MSVEITIFLMAFVFPGAIAVTMWDHTTQRASRSVHSHFGWGLLISAFMYSILQVCGYIDLLYVFDPKIQYKPDINRLLSSPNLVFFLISCLICSVGGLVAARFAHSSLGQRLSMCLFGSTLNASSWAETFRPAIGTYVHICTKSGREWIGELNRIPDKFEAGVICLRNALLLTDGGWVGTHYEVSAILIEDILFIELNFLETDSASKPGNVASSGDFGIMAEKTPIVLQAKQNTSWLNED